MREIKFRAWDIANKEMFYNAEATYDDRCDGTGCDEQCFTSVLEKSERYIVEQYTGLKDKNGKEIYEGDIVEYWNRNMAIVNFECGGFYPFAEQYNDFGCPYGEDVKVIGNIHENPELLEGIKCIS